MGNSGSFWSSTAQDETRSVARGCLLGLFLDTIMATDSLYPELFWRVRGDVYLDDASSQLSDGHAAGGLISFLCTSQALGVGVLSWSACNTPETKRSGTGSRNHWSSVLTPRL